MKKKIISNVIVGVLVAVIISGIGVGAVTLFASSDVTYDNSKSGATSTDVQGAIDELYDLANNQPYYDPYDIGTPVYYNPVEGTKCFDYVAENSLNNNKTGCMRWYIIGKTGTTIDMILDHNTTKQKAWITSSDYTTANTDGTSCSYSACNDEGPITLLAQLHTDTDGWTGVPARTDTYTDPLKGYEINYSGYRARLIEANEIAKITGADKALGWDSGKPWSAAPTIGRHATEFFLDGKYGTDSIWKTKVATSQGASKYAWLYDYTGYNSTNNCTSDGCNIGDWSGYYGYWTSAASANYSYHAWLVGSSSLFTTNDVYRTIYGVRPVITIPKS